MSSAASAAAPARTSRRRTRTTGEVSCCVSAPHAPRARTSTENVSSLGPLALTASWTCFGVQKPVAGERLANVAASSSSSSFESSDESASTTHSDSRLARIAVTIAPRVIPASPGTFSTRSAPRARRVAPANDSRVSCGGEGGSARVEIREGLAPKKPPETR